MTVYFTSDLHLGHRRVSELRGFTSTAEHDLTLYRTWAATVRRDDVVYVLGDVTGTTSTGATDHALATLKSLPGRKHLVAGNHDPVHPMHRRTFARRLPAYLDAFETVSPFLRRRLDGHEVLLSHFPYAEWGDGPERPGSRYDQYRLPDMGLPLLHGHTHGLEREHGSSLHVGLDAWALQLVPDTVVIDWLRSLPRKADS